MRLKPVEIERKFIVNSEAWKQEPAEKLFIRQGYLKDGSGRRVRTIEDISGVKKGIITIKTEIDSYVETHERFSEELEDIKIDKFASSFLDNWLNNWPREYSAPDTLKHNKKTNQVIFTWQNLNSKSLLSFDIAQNSVAFVVSQADKDNKPEEFRYQGALHSEKDWSKFLEFAKIHAPRPLGKNEEEYEIDLIEAENMLASLDKVLEKTRYVIKSPGDYKYEVDVFTNLSFELTTLEIELKSETQKVVIPAWSGQEVSFDNRYKNSQLLGSVIKKNSLKP